MIGYSVVPRPVPPADGVLAVLPEVLVPLLWWRGVAVRRAEPVSMTPLERFTLELALTTGRADPEELFEITGLPGSLLPIAARRLVAARALAVSGDAYVPVFPAADDAARTRTVYEARHVSLDVVLLPLTEDLLALDPAVSGLRAVEQLRPRSAGNAPVPASMAGRKLADYLRARLAEGTVAGAGRDVTAVAQLDVESPPVGRDGWCPVYRCRAELRQDGDRYVPVLWFPGKGDKEPTALELPGADGLVGRWRALLDALADRGERARAWDELLGWRQHVAPRAERTGPARWTCRLTLPAARRLADRGRNLALPLGLAVQGEDAVVEVVLDLAGADPEAGELVATDHLLTAAAQPGADASAVPRTASMWERAWQLGFHNLVYALREAEDFGYA
ncbi:hypothetical protein [Micromonospora sp. NPDC048830]|uniref:hypothetical protein n=1 Tax=Micromonospora sp. NPDC048830 TaxID=3364257 RepID=UPI0037246B51